MGRQVYAILMRFMKHKHNKQFKNTIAIMNL